MCTFSATFVRIAQAYFRDGWLHISYTGWIDMEEENHDNAKLLLGWMMSLTGGNTELHDVVYPAGGAS
jgi:hypothetical protein